MILMILCIITLGWAQLGGSSGLIWAYLFLTALVYISGELRCPVSLFAMSLILGKAKLLLLLLSRFSHIRLHHTQQSTRLLCPWDSPGKKTGVGCHFPSPMHESEKWKWSHSVMSDSLRPHGLQSTRLLRPWDFPGKNTGVGCHCLLQGG